ncbi:MAG: patatin-like phospholipase family protein [Pseudomonadota bacterium]
MNTPRLLTLATYFPLYNKKFYFPCKLFSRSRNYPQINHTFLFKLLLSFSFLLAFSFCSQLTHADQQPTKKDRPIIGLVLSGGGARGASHVGVLKVLEQMRIPVDIITGTSMGAITGGLYAYGYSPEELEKILKKTNWDDIFLDKPPRKQRSIRRKGDDYNYLMKLEAGFNNGEIIIPTGLIQGQKLDLLLKALMPSAPNDFDLLPIPFRAVASDIETGEAVVLDKGDIVTAMRASMSIPGVFSPVEMDGNLLVDGGFLNNVPVRLAQEMGADILIVVDLSGELRKRNELSSPLGILNQTLGFLIQRNSRDQLNDLDPMDILIQPDMGNFSSTDFWRSAEMVTIGIGAAKTHTQQLTKLSVSENIYQDYQTMRRRTIKDAPYIDRIIIKNNSPLSDKVIDSFITVRPGEILNQEILERDIAKIYGLNIFKRVSYELVHELDQTILIIKTIQKDWGPNYLRFGMNLEGNFEGSSHYNFASSLTVTPLNRLGGEWRSEIQLGSDQIISTEFYQPIDTNLRYYVKPILAYSSTHIQQYDSSKQVADYKVSNFSGTLAVGRNLGNWGAIELGVSEGSGESDQFIGDQPEPPNSFKTRYWYVSFLHDQLDNLNFPKNGQISFINWGSVNYRSSDEVPGTDVDFDVLEVGGIVARTWGTNTFMLWGDLKGIVNSDKQIENDTVFGGLFNLSGYRRYEPELSGRYSGIARLLYFRLLNKKKSTFKIPVYIGGSIETAGAWNENEEFGSGSFITAGSVLIGLDTMLGPIYLARGFAEGGKTANYFFLGRTFTF